jgi:16S rRNA (uracil1498-N3)-methyltransferase
LPLHAELSVELELVVGCLDNKDRMEWIVEKATELGAASISFVRSRYASPRALVLQRLEAKALNAMKQCRRAVLPTIREYQHLEDVLHATQAAQILVGDLDGNTPASVESSACILIGPEGGFDERERALIAADPRAQLWKLSPARLRADTAAVAMMSVAAAP